MSCCSRCEFWEIRLLPQPPCWTWVSVNICALAVSEMDFTVSGICLRMGREGSGIFSYWREMSVSDFYKFSVHNATWSPNLYLLSQSNFILGGDPVWKINYMVTTIPLELQAKPRWLGMIQVPWKVKKKKKAFKKLKIDFEHRGISGARHIFTWLKLLVVINSKPVSIHLLLLALSREGKACVCVALCVHREEKRHRCAGM